MEEGQELSGLVWTPRGAGLPSCLAGHFLAAKTPPFLGCVRITLTPGSLHLLFSLPGLGTDGF